MYVSPKFAARRDPDPRDRSRIPTAAEGRDVPGGAAATDVHATDQRIVGQALRFALLRFLDAAAVDELELVGRWREAADADASEVAVDAVGLDPLRQQFLVGQRACNAIAKELCDDGIEVSRNCADATKHANSSPGAPLWQVSDIAVFCPERNLTR